MSVRSTTRSPSPSTTSGNWRRRLSSPRMTSMTRVPCPLKIETDMTPCPIRGDPSGTTTSVKYFIFFRVPSRSAIEVAVRQEARHEKPHRDETDRHHGEAERRDLEEAERHHPEARATPSTSRLVEVPIMVIIPPRTVW